MRTAGGAASLGLALTGARAGMEPEQTMDLVTAGLLQIDIRGYNLELLQNWYLSELEDMARYAGQLLAPAEGFGLRLRLFFLAQRAFYTILQ